MLSIGCYTLFHDTIYKCELYTLAYALICRQNTWLVPSFGRSWEMAPGSLGKSPGGDWWGPAGAEPRYGSGDEAEAFL